MPRKPISLSLAVGLTFAVSVAACGSSTQTSAAGRISNAQAVRYSECIRAHGVPSFPDPIPGHPGQYPDVSPTLEQSPAFEAAQTACERVLPSPGGAAPASAATRAGLLSSARCMREHGNPNFPDPTPTLPSNPWDYSSIDDLGGIIVAIPDTIDVQAPAFQHAMTTCKAHL